MESRDEGPGSRGQEPPEHFKILAPKSSQAEGSSSSRDSLPPFAFDRPVSVKDLPVVEKVLSRVFDLIGGPTLKDEVREHSLLPSLLPNTAIANASAVVADRVSGSIQSGPESSSEDSIPVVSSDDFEEGHMLGEGGLSLVTAVRHLKTGLVYAMSQLRLDVQNVDSFEAFASAVGIANRLKDVPHVVSVDFVSERKTHDGISRVDAIYHRPVADGDLEKCLFKWCDRRPGMNKEMKLAILLHMRTLFGCAAVTVANMHKKDIQHRDIKPNNILLKGNKMFFIDFNASKDGDGRQKTSSEGEVKWKTRGYAPPEYLNPKLHGTKADVWSLGSTYWEMLCTMCGTRGRKIRDEVRYTSKDKEHLYASKIELIREKLEELEFPIFFSEEDHAFLPIMKWMVWHMLDKVPERRPRAKDLRFPRSWYCDCCPPPENVLEISDILMAAEDPASIPTLFPDFSLSSERKSEGIELLAPERPSSSKQSSLGRGPVSSVFSKRPVAATETPLTYHSETGLDSPPPGAKPPLIKVTPAFDPAPSDCSSSTLPEMLEEVGFGSTDLGDTAHNQHISAEPWSHMEGAQM